MKKFFHKYPSISVQTNYAGKDTVVGYRERYAVLYDDPVRWVEVRTVDLPHELRLAHTHLYRLMVNVYCPFLHRLICKTVYLPIEHRFEDLPCSFQLWLTPDEYGTVIRWGSDLVKASFHQSQHLPACPVPLNSPFRRFGLNVTRSAWEAIQAYRRTLHRRPQKMEVSLSSWV